MRLTLAVTPVPTSNQTAVLLIGIFMNPTLFGGGGSLDVQSTWGRWCNLVALGSAIPAMPVRSWSGPLLKTTIPLTVSGIFLARCQDVRPNIWWWVASDTINIMILECTNFHRHRIPFCAS